jgi:hypothetical protein
MITRPSPVLRPLLPRPHASRIEVRVVSAPIAAVYDAALETDFLDAVSNHIVVRALFGTRAVWERVASMVRRRTYSPPAPPAEMRLLDLDHRGAWVALGESAPREIAFGAIGRFWAGETRWLDIDAVDFAAFSAPGYAKIGCSLELASLDGGRTQLAYSALTLATDEPSQRAFMRYWRLVSPFVGMVMRATLAEIARNAERAGARRAAQSAAAGNRTPISPFSPGARVHRMLDEGSPVTDAGTSPSLRRS